MAKPQKQNKDYSARIVCIILFVASVYYFISCIIDYQNLQSFNPKTTPSYTGECISVDESYHRGKSSRNGFYTYNFLMDNEEAYSLRKNELLNKTITIDTLRTLEGQTLTIYHRPIYRAPYIFNFTFPVYRIVNGENDILIDLTEFTNQFGMIISGITSTVIFFYYLLRYINRKRKAAEKAQKQAARRASRAAARARQAEKKARKAAARQIPTEHQTTKT